MSSQLNPVGIEAEIIIFCNDKKKAAILVFYTVHAGPLTLQAVLLFYEPRCRQWSAQQCIFLSLSLYNIGIPNNLFNVKKTKVFCKISIKWIFYVCFLYVLILYFVPNHLKKKTCQSALI